MNSGNLRRALALAGAGAAASLVFTGQASASYTAQVRAGTLQITGNSASDKLLLAPTATSLVLDVGADGTADFTFDRATFTGVIVDAGGGDDEVRVLNSATPPAIDIDGGGGDDTIIGGSGAETIAGGSGNDFVDGNIGADTVSLGSGNDTFQWDPGDGSDKVDGDAGRDLMQFNGSNIGEIMDVAANGTRVAFDRDVAGISMDLGTIEDIDVRTLGGADTLFVADMQGTPLKTVNADLAAFDGNGDAAADTVNVQGTSTVDKPVFSSPAPGTVKLDGLSVDVAVTGGESDKDVLRASTLDGADVITAKAGLSGAIASASGGNGSDSARFTGTDADDQLGVAFSGTGVRTFEPNSGGLDTTDVENLTVATGDGNDTVQGQNGIAALTHLTLDGGNGDDTLAGGDGDDTVLGGNGDDHLDGNRGSDTVKGGGGDDAVQWDPGDGSDTIDGQAGYDRLDFNGSNAGEEISVSRNNSRTRLFRNIASVTQDFDTIEDVHVRALGSADTITVGDLSGTGIDAADVDLAAFDGTPDGAADIVNVDGTNKRDTVDVTRDGGTVAVGGLSATTRITGGEGALDRLNVDTLDGDDLVTVAPDVADLLQTVVTQ
jgi:Ca2+-binding RTX toxin-like protein